MASEFLSSFCRNQASIEPAELEELKSLRDRDKAREQLMEELQTENASLSRQVARMRADVSTL